MTTEQNSSGTSQELPPSGLTDPPTRREQFRRFWATKPGLLVVATVGVAAGAVLGRLFPPFVLDDAFWRAFFTSAGFGGVMALCAAAVAFGAAAYSSHRSAENASKDREQRNQAAEQDRQQREMADYRAQWWDRFTWATERALDDETRDVGLVSMIGLVGHPWASREDTDIAIAVADALDSMDTEDNENASTTGGVQ